MGHWYSQSGEPVHFQEDGKDTTLRHARKQGLVPGFSGVTSVLAKPGLDKWKEGQLLEAAFNTPVPLPDYDDGDQYSAWASEVRRLAAERSTKARDRGSEIHDAIEEYIKVGLHPDFPVEFEPYITGVQSALKDELGLDLRTLEAETTFACRLGYGGMIDALSRSEAVLLDWKTKDKEFDDKTKLAFDEHGMQLAAYRYGIGVDPQFPYSFIGALNATCANVFISPSAKIRIHVWDEEELQRLFEKFKLCLKLWQADRKYDSSF